MRTSRASVDRSRDDVFRDLRANTIAWIAVLLWLALGFQNQLLPEGPYSDMLLSIFEAVVGIVILVVSAIVVIAWIAALRERRPS